MSAASPHAPIRVGVIGGSVRSAVGYAHMAALRMDGRYAVAAGAFSRDPETNDATGAAAGLCPDAIHRDWRSMLARDAARLDAAIVLTPTPTHAEIVAECLEADLPVLCEKALASTSAEALLLRDQVASSAGFLAVTYNYSGYPIVRELRSRIASGDLGRIVQIQAEMPQEGFIRRTAEGAPAAQPQAWRLSDGPAPTLHLDLAVHLHQLVFYLTGLRPREATAMQDSFGCFEGVVDSVSALARYDNGAAASFWFTKAALGHRNGLRLRLYGERGSAEWFQAEPETLLLNHADGRREIVDRGGSADVAAQPRYARFKAGHPAGYVEAFANLYVDIADALDDYRKTGRWSSNEVCGVETALEGLLFAETLAAAARNRDWLRVPRPPPFRQIARKAS